MSERIVYHVVPNPDGGWDVEKENGQRASVHCDTKEQAIERGVELAKANPLGQLVIHNQDGKIQSERTYGEDPYPPPG